MTVSDLDLQIGQLALARGMLDLPSLLKCLGHATEQEEPLERTLIKGGHLDDACIDELKNALGSMTSEELQETVEAGETVVVKTLVAQTYRESQPYVDALLEPIERAKTLSMTPNTIAPSSLNPTQIRLDPDSEATPEKRYEFIDELGRGGMGQILRAEDHLLSRQIALKTILPHTTVEQPQERLLAEARLTGQLEHPSIIPVYELGRLSNGEPYYTMRVITEQNLESILVQLRSDDPDAPSLLQLIQIIRQVCLAVQYAHDQGVIHRDLKPENILVGEYGEVFVIDWGIAKVLSQMSNLHSPTADVDNQLGALVGTPQYMAPEQANGENSSVDERTDVFALGAMLYEVLTLTPVFSSATVLGLLMTIIQDIPEPPSMRTPDRKIPGALEEICLKALSKNPDDRYESAQTLADELDLFIEGVKDRDRKIAKARELIEEAHQARKEYDKVCADLAQTIERRDSLRASIPAWADPDQRVKVWEYEDRVEKLRVEVERDFGKTVRLLSQSLGYTSLADAHNALAQLYWERFVEAENRGDPAMATYFENLVRHHDTGQFTEQLRGLADLVVRASSEDTKLTLLRVHEVYRRLVADKVVGTSLSALDLPRLSHGRYQLRATAPGRTSLQMPIDLDRQASVQIDLKLRSRDEVPEEFILVPAGEFLTGPPAESGISQRQEYLPDYAMERTPVTCAEYLEFLNDLASNNLSLASKYAPRPQDDAPSYFPIVDGRFTIPESDADGDAWDPNWPICIVNFHDAATYANWRSERDGLTYRLPTSMEWEKAARGVDGRLYPWGNHFDPSFCRIRQTIAGKPMPAPVGTHPADASPYGVMDLAGNISEWTSSAHENAPDTYVLRGASFNSFPVMCRLDRQLSSPGTYRHSHYGFRLVLDLQSEN